MAIYDHRDDGDTCDHPLCVNPPPSQRPWRPTDAAHCRHIRTLTLGGVTECLSCRHRWGTSATTGPTEDFAQRVNEARLDDLYGHYPAIAWTGEGCEG